MEESLRQAEDALSAKRRKTGVLETELAAAVEEVRRVRECQEETEEALQQAEGALRAKRRKTGVLETERAAAVEEVRRVRECQEETE